MNLDVALVRVDNRLVHGQILEAWIPYTKASCIAVVDDGVANDVFNETVIRMAVPHDIELIVSSVEDFAANYSYRRDKGSNTIVLFSSIGDAFRAFKLGFRYDGLNIGNCYAEVCAKHCTTSVTLSDEDIHDIGILLEEGVKVELRRIPRDKPIDARKIMPMIIS